MNKVTKSLFIILIIIALAMTIVACTPDAGENKKPDDTGVPAPSPEIEGLEVAEKISAGLKNAGGVVSTQKIRHARSEYTVIVNQINLTILYEADYNLNRKQDSEIMLKIYNNQLNKNAMFFYYYESTLYYEINGSRKYVPQFGGTTYFDMFFDFVSIFDMESYFFADDTSRNDDGFIEEEDDIGLDSFSSYLTMIILGAEPKSLSLISRGEVENITIKDVVLDSAKESLNNFFQVTIKDNFGTRLDALTTMLMGIKLSDVGDIGIGILNASLIEIVMKNDAVTDIDIVFDGMQSDNINDFFVGLKYSTSGESKRITLDKFDDPALNKLVAPGSNPDENPNGYWLAHIGQTHLVGELYIDGLDETFAAEIKANINNTNNSLNKLLIDIRNKTQDLDPDSPYFNNKSIISMFYNHENDETMYVDIEGFMGYIGGGIDLAHLNFPRVKFESINLAEEINLLLSYIQAFGGGDLDSTSIIGIFASGNMSENLKMLLSKINSRGNVIEINLDTQLLTAIMGDYSTNLVQWLSITLGIGEETINNLMGITAFDAVNLKLSYNIVTGEIGISVFNGIERMFALSLYSQINLHADFVVEPATGFDPSEYSTIGSAEAVTLHLETELTMQGKSSVDFSRLMGVFIGDVTGANTPFSFGINDSFYLSMDLWQKDGLSYVMASLWLNPTYNSVIHTASNITSAPLIKFYTSKEDPSFILIDSADGSYADDQTTPIKYRITREGLNEALEELLGKNNMFTSANVMETYKLITRDTMVFFKEDHITFTLSPRSVGGIAYDPIFELIGVESMLALCMVQVKFEAPEFNIDESQFVTPEISSLEDISFESMYEARWYDSVDVFFGSESNKITYKLTFQGESAELVTGVYHYTPTAKLLGEEVGYVMILRDETNGTKRIVELRDSILVIDPTVENPIPSTIGVYYDDDTIGEQPFEIVDFPYTKDNIKDAINGMAPQDFTVIIGKGSIAETRFVLPIEVLGRMLVANAYYGNIPIVAELNIDPYSYSLQKRADYSYDPLADYRVMELSYYSNRGSNIIVKEITHLDWAFDESLINFRGGVYHIRASINSLTVALRVNIIAKIVDYIQIGEENKGEYTVDSLLRNTYTIPSYTTVNTEVRIYFQSKSDPDRGRYRIIGNQPEGWVNDDPYCDGYYPSNLKWLYPNADNVILDRTINPLNGGRTNINETTFGDNIAGVQQVRLTVLAPSRRLANMNDNVQAITTLVSYPSGGIDEFNTVRESIRISAVGFGEIGSETDVNGAFFKVDPYASDAVNRLPSHINMWVEDAGKTVRKSYLVSWIASSIIDSSGNVLKPTSEESLLRATGWIGEVEGNKQIVTLIIHNLSGAYEVLEMSNPNILDEDGNPTSIIPEDGKYVININPYDDYKLPENFILHFSEASGYAPQKYQTEWTIMGENGELIYITDGYAFPYSAGEYELTTYVAADPSSGILAQTVRLFVRLEDMTIIEHIALGLSEDMDNGNTLTLPNGMVYVEVDTYHQKSGRLLDNLESLNVNRVGIRFINNTMVSENVPVVWDNLNELIDVLKDPKGSSEYPNGIITLSGKIYKGSVLEQNLSINFMVIERTINGISFSRMESYREEGIVDVEVKLKGQGVDTGTVTITLNKPFALVGKMGYLGYNVGENLDKLASNFIHEMFAETRLIFGGISEQHTLKYELPEDFDYRAFDFPNMAPRSLVTFTVDKMSEGGSCAEKLVVNFYTIRDTILETEITRFEETFNQNGSLKYSNETGYAVPTNITINYQNSGPVTYTNLVWRAKVNHNAGAETLLALGQEVATIPAKLFDTMNGNYVFLYADLEPQMENISLTIRFHAKDIGYVAYNAVNPNDNLYSIEQGKISIANVYEVYPFDPSKLPSIITPRTSSSYQIDNSENPITFGVVWVPHPRFASDNDPSAFSQEKINSYINSRGLVSDYDGAKEEYFAIAQILIYDNEMQEVKVFVEVAELKEGNISHSALEIEDNTIVIDPYVNNFGGEYQLPSDIKVSFGNASYQFSQNSDISYYIKNITTGIYEGISVVPYTHLGHNLPAQNFGNATDLLELKVVLPDNKEIEFTLQFMSRELEEIRMENKVTKVDINGDPVSGYLRGVYYIDPYDASTYQVPTSAMFGFKEGHDISLPISYWNTSQDAPFDENYRLIWQEDTYKGATYTFYSSLSGYGVEAQPFEITVIVLDRSLREAYNKTHTFDNPIKGLVSDIHSQLLPINFVALTDEIYSKYNDIAQPVLPTITWDLTNDDIVYSGISNKVVAGSLSYGEIKGEGAKVTISANKWTFVRIVGAENGIIEFNPHTLKSVEQSFEIVFLKNDGEEVSETFYPLEWLPQNPQGEERMIIDWGNRDSREDMLKTLTLGNSHKSIKISVVNQYRYRYRQVNITEINFGFGVGYEESNTVELVIDPLNPVIPTTALARGVDTSTGELEDLGVIDVIWDAEIYNMSIMGGEGGKIVSADLISADGRVTKFNVIVYYLDRRPINIYTPNREFSSLITQVPGLGYPLRLTLAGGAVANYFQIDPISDSSVTYDSKNQVYLLPNSITITFRNSYTNTTIQNALDVLGQNLTFNNIKWGLDGEIDLTGTIRETELGTVEEPLKASLESFFLSYLKAGERVTTPVMGRELLDASFDLDLNVLSREVERTSISTMIVPTDGSAPYQRALSEYFIDPYAVSFPSSISIKLTGDSIERQLTDIEWVYDEEYLERWDVITGKIAESNPNAMNIMGYVKIRGTTLGIQFPIKPRFIDTAIPGTVGTNPLSGGKIYVLAGQPLRPQLPKFLYYKFIIDGEMDVAAVPLTFKDAAIAAIDTSRVGMVYDGDDSLEGSLGVDSGNIEFIIEIIDPKIYSIKTANIGGVEIYSQGGFIYDNILVAINSNNYHIQGREEAFLPNQIIINSYGHYLTVTDRVYNISEGYATIHCSYVFLSSSDSQELSGTKELGEGMDRLTISFDIPIETYNHTRIDDNLVLSNDRLNVPLGKPILASNMPTAYIEGKPERYQLIWDMSNLDINKAGEYVCYGYYKTTYDNDVPLALMVVVEKDRAVDADFTISNSWLNREYTGEVIDLDEHLTIKEFLRSDGAYGHIEGYRVEYSYDGGLSWIENQQPVDVLSGGGSYRVRITILDYNVMGSRIFTLNIRQKLINAGDVTFHHTEDGVASTSLVYEYNGSDRLPVIKGIPQGAVYNIVYQQYIEATDSYIDARPLNAGTYRATVTIPAQRNFQSTVASFVATITITRKNVDYEVKSELVYNGTQRDAVVIGLPEVLGDIRVTYIYFDADGNQLAPGSRVQNVGTYYVTVQIQGGINYPSANVGGIVNTNLTSAPFQIIKKQVIMMVGDLSTEYLDPLLPLNSAVTFMDADNPNLPGLQGSDTNAIFRDQISVYWVGGTLTYKHMVGDYTLKAMANISHQNYEVISYIDGTYHITADSEGAVVINNKAELDNRIATLNHENGAGSTVKWYLRAGHYGSIVINQNATVSIVGSYDLNSGEEIAVTFDSITVKRGGVTIDIVKMSAVGNSSLITIENGASDVTVSRSLLYRSGSNFITGSVAVKTTSGYSNTLNMVDTTVRGFSMGAYMLGGSADIQGCTFDDNIGSVQVRNATTIVLIGNKFLYTRGGAVYIACQIERDNISINDNDFVGSVVAIKTYSEVNNDLLMVQNRFKYNSIDIQYIV